MCDNKKSYIVELSNDDNNVFVIFEPVSAECDVKEVWKWISHANKFVQVNIEEEEEEKILLFEEQEQRNATWNENQTFILTSSSTLESSSTLSTRRARNIYFFDALYGVLTIAEHMSFLLYVPESRKVATLNFTNSHEEDHGQMNDDNSVSIETNLHANTEVKHHIYEVTKLEWLKLPSCKDICEVNTECGKQKTENVNDVTNTDVNSSGGGDKLKALSQAANEHEYIMTSEKRKKNTTSEYDNENEYYTRLLEEFCTPYTFYTTLRQEKSASFFYYSPTCNLALPPHTLITTFSAPKVEQTSEDECTENTTMEESIRTFQWNRTLVNAFPMNANIKVSSVYNNNNSNNNSENLTKINTHVKEDYNATHGSVNETKKESKSIIQHTEKKLQKYRLKGHAHKRCHVPAFIRGYVEESNNMSDICRICLVTRLACRWCGTRYNRRGAEPNMSGVCANMAITSLWLFCNHSLLQQSVNETQTNNTKINVTTDLNVNNNSNANNNTVQKKERTNNNDSNNNNANRVQGDYHGEWHVAVIETLRGSVPLRWSQPPNLDIKPTIYIDEKINQMEFLQRHFALLTNLLPFAEELLLMNTMSTSRHETLLSSAYKETVRAYSDINKSDNNQQTNMTCCDIDSESSNNNNSETIIALDDEESISNNTECTSIKVQEVFSNDESACKLECTRKESSHWKCIKYLNINLVKYIRKYNLFSAMSKLLVILRNEVSNKPHLSSAISDDKNEDATLHDLLELPWIDYSLYRIASERKVPHINNFVQLKRQTHYTRVNCLDCIDRTNIAQLLLLQAFLLKILWKYVTLEEYCLEEEEEYEQEQQECKDNCTLTELQQRYSTELKDFDKMQEEILSMVTNQGIALSLLYAHSETHFKSTMHTRESCLNRVLSGGKIVIKRWFHQNFCDGVAQDAYSLLTNQCNNLACELLVKQNRKRRVSTKSRRVKDALLAFLTVHPIWLFVLCIFVTASMIVIPHVNDRISNKCNTLTYMALTVIFILPLYLFTLYKRARSYLINSIDRTELSYDL